MPHENDRNIVYRALSPGSPAAQAARARRVLVACALTVTAGVAGLMALLYPSGDPDDGPDRVAERLIDPSVLWVPSVPVSVLPAPSSSFSSFPTDPVYAEPTRTHHVPRANTTTTAPSPSPTTHPAPSSVPELKVGSTVSLAVAAAPDYLLRHRNFIGRVDRIGSDASPPERADSQFVVRTGLGRSDCVSLESVNYPGYFLRHRDFVLRLERRDGSSLFAQDATFCTSLTPNGNALVLNSINYPGYALVVHADGVVHLDRGAGTAFVVRAPR
jgi:hypothetical protein